MTSPEMTSQTVDDRISGAVIALYQGGECERVIYDVTKAAIVKHIIDYRLTLKSLTPEEAEILSSFYKGINVTPIFTQRFSGHYPITDSDINLVLVAGTQNSTPTTRIVRLDIIQEKHLDANTNHLR